MDDISVVFVSNYYNHHQASFCQAMYSRLADNFAFIQTMEMEAERKRMGWGGEALPPFVKKSYGDASSKAEARERIRKADVVIIGSAPERLVRERIKRGKLVIRYGERPLKKGLELWKYPYRYLKWHIRNPKGAKVALLCASAYTSADYAKFHLFQGRCYRWGYFPERKQYENVERMIAGKRPSSLLWVARFIDWKHPELPILIAKRLKEENYDFTMELIGTGVLEKEIRDQIRELQLEDCVQMLGSMKPEQVRRHMEQSQIFLFTSDKKEGWGAVLNEAMNSGCAVVASHGIGSVPYLLRDGENGSIYKDGDIEDLYRKVKTLLDDPQRSFAYGKRAYQTINEEWNAETAAERLLQLIDTMLAGEIENDLFPGGPCSRAENLEDDWFAT